MALLNSKINDAAAGAGPCSNEPAPNTRFASAAVKTGQGRLRQGMKVQIEADQCCGSHIVLGIGQLVDINRKTRDLVTVRLVACGRTRAAVTVGAEIGPALDRALG